MVTWIIVLESFVVYSHDVIARVIISWLDQHGSYTIAFYIHKITAANRTRLFIIYYILCIIYKHYNSVMIVINGLVFFSLTRKMCENEKLLKNHEFDHCISMNFSQSKISKNKIKCRWKNCRRLNTKCEIYILYKCM